GNPAMPDRCPRVAGRWTAPAHWPGPGRRAGAETAAARARRRAEFRARRSMPACHSPVSGQPALAPTVELGFAEAGAARSRDAQIEFLDILVLGQRAGGAIHHHAAV